MAEEDGDARAARIRVMSGVQTHTEALIRAYDLKAEIAMLSFVLSVDAVHVLANLDRVRGAFPRLSLFLVFLFLSAVSSYIYVLLPRTGNNRPAGHNARGVLFVDPARHATVDAYMKALKETDIEREMAHQVLELANISAVKRWRFLLAIALTAVFYVSLMLLCFTA